MNEVIDEVVGGVDNVVDSVDEVVAGVDSVDEVVDVADKVVDSVDKVNVVDVIGDVADVETQEPQVEIEVVAEKGAKTKQELIDRLSEVVALPVDEAVKAEIDAIKQNFYKLKRTETEAAKKAFVEAGGLEEEFMPETDALEEDLKRLLADFREKKAALSAEKEKEQTENLKKKQAIILQIKALADTNGEDFQKSYDTYKQLQKEWKAIGQVSQTLVNDLWKEYHHDCERFYDLVKINNEMRDYDFKKNLELKVTLCEAGERLDAEQDVISAFYQLQKLHDEWREIGPVAREVREEIWTRFKAASSVINKKHQEHFDALKEKEEANLVAKTALYEVLEAIDYSKLTNAKEWDEQNKQVLELQAQWKTIGFAPKKDNVKIFARFRAACDTFFQAKSDFYKGLKSDLDSNLSKKQRLCEQAEALKDSEDWKVTTDKLIAFQKEWKTIGQVPRRHSDAVWKRFVAACDAFFERKKSQFSSRKSEETENLQKKKDIIEQVKNFDTAIPADQAIPMLKEFRTQFNAAGHVPFREKDKIHDEFNAVMDVQFDRLKVANTERRLQNFQTSVKEVNNSDEKSKPRLLDERDRLLRQHERLRNDIQTYENNIGFLTVSSKSKGGNGLVKDLQRKIDDLKAELVLLEKKVQVIDDGLGF
ncbi:hypothetical protein AGMMS49525_06320 [Bacteroidia bacterium]|nr:hypothetical protein AGMMS49525_06320 [Bacteroidia bacterium]